MLPREQGDLGSRPPGCGLSQPGQLWIPGGVAAPGPAPNVQNHPRCHSLVPLLLGVAQLTHTEGQRWEGWVVCTGSCLRRAETPSAESERPGPGGPALSTFQQHPISTCLPDGLPLGTGCCTETLTLQLCPLRPLGTSHYTSRTLPPGGPPAGPRPPLPAPWSARLLPPTGSVPPLRFP